MLQKKQFKYYAIRVGNTVVFRRTTGVVQKVRSVLYKPLTDFRLVQTSYTGGRILGCMDYKEWRGYGLTAIAAGNCIRIERDVYRSLDPYITKEKVINTVPTEI